MAPEQLAGGAVDSRTDVYAVGVLLGEMLAGRHPLARGERPAFAPPLDAIVARCLQADPEARFRSADDLRSALVAAGGAGRALEDDARWWWRFHQGAVALAYAALLVPAWLVRSFMGGRVGLLVFLLLMAGGIVAITLRLHLWFVSRVAGGDLPAQRAQTRPWLRLADGVFAAGLLASGLFVGAEEPVLAIVLSGAAVIVTVAFLVIEPSTARAAFREVQFRTRGMQFRTEELPTTNYQLEAKDLSASRHSPLGEAFAQRHQRPGHRLARHLIDQRSHHRADAPRHAAAEGQRFELDHHAAVHRFIAPIRVQTPEKTAIDARRLLVLAGLAGIDHLRDSGRHAAAAGAAQIHACDTRHRARCCTRR